MPNAKGFFPEDHPQYVGIYWGEVSSPQCQAIVDWSDLIVAAGPVFNDYTTVGWSALPPRHRLMSVETSKGCGFPTSNSPVSRSPSSCPTWPRSRPNTATPDPSTNDSTGPHCGGLRDVEPAAALSRAEMWRQIEQDLDSKTTLLVETGDSWLNGMYTRLPGDARFEIEMQYGSIGWSVPASFGWGWAWSLIGA